MLIKILVAYSTVMTTVLAPLTLAGAAAARGQSRVQQFDEIDVRRINLREPDGTLRMVISNHARLPGVIVRGKENPPVDRSYAGMLFYNDEGTESGGLVFGGHQNAKGEVTNSGGMLTFDRYAGSQIVQLAGVHDATTELNNSSQNEFARQHATGGRPAVGVIRAAAQSAGRNTVVIWKRGVCVQRGQ